jgi:hypothetical protein
MQPSDVQDDVLMANSCGGWLLQLHFSLLQSQSKVMGMVHLKLLAHP